MSLRLDGIAQVVNGRAHILGMEIDVLPGGSAEIGPGVNRLVLDAAPAKVRGVEGEAA